ncbi:MAG TPA: F0F1 ATP synthase subunit B [Thermomicrobiales bacterium]|nr:F0F1 ATP synthase subunit B [Thermomicrobiales bacterium]
MGDLGIDAWKLLIQLIAFLVFLYILWKKALGPIVEMIDSRSEKIQESMSAAEKMQADLKQTATRNEEALMEARKEAQQIIANAREASEGMLNKAREDAGKQGDEYLARAQAALRAETEQARLQLRQELAGLAVSAAGKIVRKELDPGTQASLIDETLAEATSSIGRG